MGHPAIAAVVHAPTSEVVSSEGAGPWVLNERKAAHQTYLVCCHPLSAHARIQSYTAFLIGEISRLIPVGLNERNQTRFRIQLRNYASTDTSIPWRDWRNPVRYTSLEELGIDIRSLVFDESSYSVHSDAPPRCQQKLSIEDAKRELAATYEVDPSRIAIKIKKK